MRPLTATGGRDLLRRRRRHLIAHADTEADNGAQANRPEVAAALGVSRQTVISIESGRYLPSLPLAFRIARFFELPVDKMFDPGRGQRRGCAGRVQGGPGRKQQHPLVKRQPAVRFVYAQTTSPGINQPPQQWRQ